MHQVFGADGIGDPVQGVAFQQGINTASCVTGDGRSHYKGSINHRSERKYFTQFSHYGPTTQYLI